MAPSEKPEWPPLLGAGLHPMSLAELEKLAVQAFPESQSRRRIFSSLKALIRHLVKVGMTGELWIDGSFLTEKVNPDDADVVIKVPASVLNNGSPELQQVAKWVAQNDRGKIGDCHIQFLPELPNWHKHYPLFVQRRDYWLHWFGHAAKSKDEKGIVKIQLSECGDV